MSSVDAVDAVDVSDKRWDGSKAYLEELLHSQCIDAEKFWSLEGPVIGTHNGRFHLDEILAISILMSLPRWKGARILRSRDADVLSKCDVLVDVGGVYDAASCRFDHHQKGFDEKFDFSLNGDEKQRGEKPDITYRQPVTKLSSAGLVYRHLGKELLQERFGVLDPQDLRAMFVEVYVRFLEAVDAIDNGVAMCQGGLPLYVDHTGLSSRVGGLYPVGSDQTNAALLAAGWDMFAAKEAAFMKLSHGFLWKVAASVNEKGLLTPFSWIDLPILGGSPLEVWAFRKALKMADEELASCISRLLTSWLPGRAVLRQAILDQRAGEYSYAVVELPHWTPTEGHIYALERELDLSPVLFTVYPTEKGEGSEKTVSWTVRCVNKEGQTFESRLPLHERFRALRGQLLGEAVVSSRRGGPAVQPEDFEFCHATGFVGFAKTRDAVYEMIGQTLEAEKAASLPAGN